MKPAVHVIFCVLLYNNNFDIRYINLVKKYTYFKSETFNEYIKVFTSKLVVLVSLVATIIIVKS